MSDEKRIPVTMLERAEYAIDIVDELSKAASDPEKYLQWAAAGGVGKRQEIYLQFAGAAALVSIAGSLERLASHVTGEEIPDPDDDGTPAAATVLAYAREHGITSKEALEQLGAKKDEQ